MAAFLRIPASYNFHMFTEVGEQIIIIIIIGGVGLSP
jgi:hypothetical protein